MLYQIVEQYWPIFCDRAERWPAPVLVLADLLLAQTVADSTEYSGHGGIGRQRQALVMRSHGQEASPQFTEAGTVSLQST